MNTPFIWYKNLGSRLFRFVRVHTFYGQTDRRTDGQIDFDRRTVRIMHLQ